MAELTAAAARTIIVSGADRRFFFLLDELIASLEAAPALPPVELGCYDLGLDPAQVAALQARGVRVVQPTTGLEIGALAGDASKLGYLARPFLPDNFPGYDVYVWLDADTWIQHGDAVRQLIAGATEAGAALVREDDPSYRFSAPLFGWKAKHYLRGYGLRRAMRLILRRQVNNGVFAMRGDAPHWAVWRRLYQRALDRTGDAAPHDQFALNVAAYLEGLPARFLPATLNWICDLAHPWWDGASNRFCTPDRQHRPIGIVHLAGPVKTAEFDVRTTDGGTVRRLFRFGAGRVSPGRPAPAGAGNAAPAGMA